MSAEITEKKEWLEIDGRMGREWVPVDLIRGAFPEYRNPSLSTVGCENGHEMDEESAVSNGYNLPHSTGVPCPVCASQGNDGKTLSLGYRYVGEAVSIPANVRLFTENEEAWDMRIVRGYGVLPDDGGAMEARYSVYPTLKEAKEAAREEA